MGLKEMTLEQLMELEFEAMVETSRALLAVDAIVNEKQDWTQRLEAAGAIYKAAAEKAWGYQREIQARAKEQARQG